MKQKKSSMSRIVQLYDGSRYVNCDQADNEGELYTVVMNKPSQIDDIRKIVDTTAEVLGKALPILLF
ncbi:hypothetical protein G7588_003225 [Salmonella enterica subsp. enterica serovar Braenderup]|nr:hypothetical protein [Salmonella enterica subsp. enterica serovar Braenderup]